MTLAIDWFGIAESCLILGCTLAVGCRLKSKLGPGAGNGAKPLPQSEMNQAKSDEVINADKSR